VDVPAERRRLGYVPQDSALFPHSTSSETSRSVSATAARERRDRAGAWLTKTGPSPTSRGRRIAALSGGERQRASPWARALRARSPAASCWMSRSRRSIPPRAASCGPLSALARRLAAAGADRSHDPSGWHRSRIASRVMERGRIVQQGTASSLRAAPVSDFVAGFTA